MNVKPLRMNSITRLAVARTAIPVLVYNHALAPKNARLRNATILACETSLVKLAKSPMEIVYGEIVYVSFLHPKYY